MLVTRRPRSSLLLACTTCALLVGCPQREVSSRDERVAGEVDRERAKTTTSGSASSSAQPGVAVARASGTSPGASVAEVMPGEGGATLPSSASAMSASARASSAEAAPRGSSGDPPPGRCPDDMRLVGGGRFTTGTDDRAGNFEEWPRFETDVASFCLERSEVSVKAYGDCVTRGACTRPDDRGRFCNARFPDREDHPVNCVDFTQAEAYCTALGRRLPGEIEWEYAARGGAELRAYSWGNESPDGRTCWKHPGGTCKIGSYAPGAFDLLDMTGNVWEWTADWFGPYPFPPEHGTARVNKGGSWSRRFEKWMRPGLRSRTPPKERGSHLGFRCALSLAATVCPYGSDERGLCRRGVSALKCDPGASFNGVRCARSGAPRCAEGRVEKAGHGCVLAVDVTGPLAEVATTPVSRARTPNFDADCAAHYPGRPSSYRYAGGTHAERNSQSRAAGCSNRDVGVGWNSTCCP